MRTGQPLPAQFRKARPQKLVLKPPPKPEPKPEPPAVKGAIIAPLSDYAATRCAVLSKSADWQVRVRVGALRPEAAY